jgi:hypothetical protein
MGADQTAKYNEEAVGSGHPTKADTVNRLTLVEHNTDGTHKMSSAVAGDTFYFDGTKLTRIPKGTAGQSWRMKADITGPEWASGGLIQAKHAAVTALVSGSTVMPVDDTIPQITEGNEIIPALAITPQSATNILLFFVNLGIASGISSPWLWGTALFQTGVSNALAAVAACTIGYTLGGGGSFQYRMVAGVTTEISFSVRAGQAAAGTVYVNNVPGATGRVFGGVAASTLTIMEVTP